MEVEQNTVTLPGNESHYVYWIRTENHTDPYTEGYIGVSAHPALRLKDHMKNNKHFFEDPTSGMEILHEFNTQKECFEIEKKYRPSRNIGWNKAKGGSGKVVKLECDSSDDKGSVINFRTSPELKKAFMELCKKQNSTATTRFNDYMRRMVEEGENGQFPNTDTRKENDTELRDMVYGLMRQYDELRTEFMLLKKEKNIPSHSKDPYAYYPLGVPIPRFTD